MGSARRLIAPIPILGEITGTARRERRRERSQKRQEEALANAAAAKALEEKVETVPDLETEEVQEAGRTARRKIQRLAGRRSTIKSPRRVALGAQSLALGDRPIGRPTLGGF